MLDRLLRQVEKRAGSARLTIQRPTRGQWAASLYYPHEDPDSEVFVTAYGDTAVDALENLLADPKTRACR